MTLDQYDGSIGSAKSYMNHYFKVLFDKTDTQWNEDNESELESMVDAIVQAAIERIERSKPLVQSGLTPRQIEIIQRLVENGINFKSTQRRIFALGTDDRVLKRLFSSLAELVIHNELIEII
jgi:predicted transcriptional regulator YheO